MVATHHYVEGRVPSMLIFLLPYYLRRSNVTLVEIHYWSDVLDHSHLTLNGTKVTKGDPKH